MIVDVRTHLSAYRDAVAVDQLESHSEWRPDWPVQIPVSEDDYLVAQKPPDIPIVFLIASKQEQYYPDDSWYTGNLNDAAANFNEPIRFGSRWSKRRDGAYRMRSSSLLIIRSRQCRRP